MALNFNYLWMRSPEKTHSSYMPDKWRLSYFINFLNHWINNSILMKSYVDSLKRISTINLMSHPKDGTFIQLLSSSQHLTPYGSFSSLGGVGVTGWIITISCKVCIKGQLYLISYELVRDLRMLRSEGKFKTYSVYLQCTTLALGVCLHTCKEVSFHIVSFHMCPFQIWFLLRIMSLGSQ